MMKDTITFRYRMSDRDVFYGGGVVNGATTNMYLLTLFSLTFFVLSGAKTVQTECIIK